MALPSPIGKQKEVVTLRPEGHAVVLGTAGSGKTTMAIHRAAFVADERADHGGRTLLVTFNRALVTYLNHLCPPELRNVDVRTYHHFARGYLASRGLMSMNAICENDLRDTIITEAIASVRARRNGQALLDRPLEFFSEEIRWINYHGLDTEAEYVRAERIGRSTARLRRRADRPVMYEVYQEYKELRASRYRRTYDWDDLASASRRALDEDQSQRMYRHVVIDEGQDFSPEMTRSLALAIPVDGSLTMFADVAQQIYGRRISWADAGLKISEPWRFEKNYRNSPQIANLGLAIAAMPYYAGEPDMVAPTEFAADGPMPALVRFDSAGEEQTFVIDQARRAAASGSVAVLVRRRSDEGFLRRAFPGAQRLHRDLPVWNPRPGVSYGTYHAAKGLEFDTVILPRLSAANMPDPEAVEALGEEEATAGDGRLLYVGVTRARQNLIMTFSGELTPLMPPNDGLWLESRR
jgi:superfamily I DNA/RNA helicase